eukprot:scaffold20053_cov18-Tisochrysis_lutea.AAC.1
MEQQGYKVHGAAEQARLFHNLCVQVENFGSQGQHQVCSSAARDAPNCHAAIKLWRTGRTRPLN